MRRFVRSFQMCVQDGIDAMLLFSARLANAYIVLVSGALALALASMADTLGMGMASFMDSLSSSINGIANTLDTSVIQAASNATIPVVRVGIVVASLVVGLERSLWRIRSIRIELTPLRLLVLGLVLDWLFGYPVNKLWDFIWRNLLS